MEQNRNLEQGGAGRRLVFCLTEEDAGRSIRAYLKGRHGFSRRILSRLMRTPGTVTLDGAPVPLNFFLTAPGTLALTLPEEQEAPLASAAQEAAVVWEDDDLIVLDKPAGMPTHPSAGHQTDTLANALAARQRARGESYIFRPVNRLDRNTTGLVLAAKNAYAASRLAGVPEKRYFALVHGRVEEAGVIDAPIRRREGSRIEREVGAGGDPAVTRYTPLGSAADYTLLTVTTETGRTHQIRVHLASVGHPLVGDDLYGGCFALGMRRHALHCGEMWFSHPVTGETLRFRAPLPADFAAACAAAGLALPAAAMEKN